MGHLLETLSLPLPNKAGDVILYRFAQKFEITPDETEKQLKMLKSMVAKNSKNPIKFLLVSEPMDTVSGKYGECEEVG